VSPSDLNVCPYYIRFRFCTLEKSDGSVSVFFKIHLFDYSASKKLSKLCSIPLLQMHKFFYPAYDSEFSPRLSTWCSLQLGVIVVYGVDRDGVPAGAERPFGDLCVRSFIMHASMEYSEIIMTGACADEGKTYRAVASSKPSIHIQYYSLTTLYTVTSPCSRRDRGNSFIVITIIIHRTQSYIPRKFFTRTCINLHKI